MTDADHSTSGGEISVEDIVHALRENWLRVLSAVIVSSAIGAVLALLLPSKYTATVIMTPASQDGAGGGSLSALAGQLGGLSSLAGISLPSSGGKKDEAIATLQSRALTNDYIDKNNLLPILFESDWNAATQRWKSSDPEDQPTLWDAYKLFVKKIRQVREEKKSGIVTMTIEWTDPKLAARWANELVDSTNKLLQQRAIDKFTHNIEFLEGQLEKTTVVEIRQALFRLIEEQYKRLMLAKGSDQFAFQIIDAAVVPEERSSPKRAMIVFSFAFIGFSAGSAWAFLRGRKQSTISLT